MYPNNECVSGQSKSGSVITSLCGDRNPYHLISQGQYLFLNFETTHQNFGDLKGVELHFEVFGKLTVFFFVCENSMQNLIIVEYLM